LYTCSRHKRCNLKLRVPSVVFALLMCWGTQGRGNAPLPHAFWCSLGSEVTSDKQQANTRHILDRQQEKSRFGVPLSSELALGLGLGLGPGTRSAAVVVFVFVGLSFNFLAGASAT
jgi:hypothetical protein